MSHTDKTDPYFRVVEPRGECDGRAKCDGNYPCKHFSSSRPLGAIKRKMRRSDRTRVRSAISQGQGEYENVPLEQNRGRALWDLV